MNEASARLGSCPLNSFRVVSGLSLSAPCSVTFFKTISLHGHLLCSYRAIISKPGIASTVPQDLNLCYIFENL